QHSFSDSSDVYVRVYTFLEGIYSYVKHSVPIPKKRLLRITIENIQEDKIFNEIINDSDLESLKISLDSTWEEFKLFKKTKKHKELKNKGINIVCKKEYMNTEKTKSQMKTTIKNRESEPD